MCGDETWYALVRLSRSLKMVALIVVAAELLLTGKTGLGIAFLGYSLGNVGLYIEALK